jgi:hypothetical protein
MVLKERLSGRAWALFFPESVEAIWWFDVRPDTSAGVLAKALVDTGKATTCAEFLRPDIHYGDAGSSHCGNRCRKRVLLVVYPHGGHLGRIVPVTWILFPLGGGVTRL